MLHTVLLRVVLLHSSPLKTFPRGFEAPSGRGMFESRAIQLVLPVGVHLRAHQIPKSSLAESGLTYLL